MNQAIISCLHANLPAVEAVLKDIELKGITKITPSSAFAANLATAFVVILSSGYGFPVSTTHTLIGAVIGVGLVNSSKSLSWGKVGQIFSGWIITIPIGAILSILIFLVFKAIYSF